MEMEELFQTILVVGFKEANGKDKRKGFQDKFLFEKSDAQLKKPKI